MAKSDRKLGVQPYCVRGVPYKRQRLSFTGWLKKHRTELQLLLLALCFFSMLSFFPLP